MDEQPTFSYFQQVRLTSRSILIKLIKFWIPFSFFVSSRNSKNIIGRENSSSRHDFCIRFFLLFLGNVNDLTPCVTVFVIHPDYSNQRTVEPHSNVWFFVWEKLFLQVSFFENRFFCYTSHGNNLAWNWIMIYINWMKPLWFRHSKLHWTNLSKG